MSAIELARADLPLLEGEWGIKGGMRGGGAKKQDAALPAKKCIFSLRNGAAPRTNKAESEIKMAANDMDQLGDVRAQIDAIDRQLFDLLVERSHWVARVAALKHGDLTGLPLRPEREARQLMQLRAWHRASDAPVPFDSIIRIWREIIGAGIAQQGGMTVIAQAQHLAGSKEYFGAACDYHSVSTAAEALTRADRDQAIAVIAVSDFANWYSYLSDHGQFCARLSWVGYDDLIAYAPLPIQKIDPSEGFCHLMVVDRSTLGHTMTVLTDPMENGKILVEISAAHDLSQMAQARVIGGYANFS